MKTHSNNLVVLAHVQLEPFYRLSTRDVTHVRKCTRPSPAFPYYNRQKAGRSLGTRLPTYWLTSIKRQGWKNDTRCRDGAKTLWCHSYLVWLLNSNTTCSCNHLYIFSWKVCFTKLEKFTFQFLKLKKKIGRL